MVRAVFMGSDEFSLPVLSHLHSGGPTLESPVEVVAVVTQPDRAGGRGRKTVVSPVKRFAEECGIPVLQPQRIRDEAALEEFRATLPELVVVASYGQILPKAVLDEPKFRCLNLHPSLLPRYRGPSPISGPILAGDGETGVTLMLMARRMDAGDILAQERTAIGPEETAGELAGRLAEMSADLLLKTLPGWLAGTVRGVPQDEEAATYTRLLTKADGEIDWTRPAQEIARDVRAYDPWPGTYTWWSERRLGVLRARAVEGAADPGEVTRQADGSLAVGTGAGLLALERVQLAGGKPLTVKDLLAGHPALVGTRLGGSSR